MLYSLLAMESCDCLSEISGGTFDRPAVDLPFSERRAQRGDVYHYLLFRCLVKASGRSWANVGQKAAGRRPDSGNERRRVRSPGLDREAFPERSWRRDAADPRPHHEGEGAPPHGGGDGDRKRRGHIFWYPIGEKATRTVKAEAVGRCHLSPVHPLNEHPIASATALRTGASSRSRKAGESTWVRVFATKPRPPYQALKGGGGEGRPKVR